MRYTSTLLAVRDMEKAKGFYRSVLGLEVVADFGANVTLTGGIALQTLETWKEFIQKDDIAFGNNACELYFEEDDIEDFAVKLKSFDIEYVHELIEHAWGQRVVRFYDFDRHIIEVGENIVSVVKRFIDSGLSEDQTAARMDVPLEYIKSWIKQ